MGKCSKVGCTNSSSGPNRQHTLHRFPRDPKMRRLWEKQLDRRERGGMLWRSTENSMLCSDHFDDNCFKIGKKNNKLMRKDAVPTYFDGKIKPIKVISIKPSKSETAEEEMEGDEQKVNLLHHVLPKKDGKKPRADHTYQAKIDKLNAQGDLLEEAMAEISAEQEKAGGNSSSVTKVEQDEKPKANKKVKTFEISSNHFNAENLRSHFAEALTYSEYNPDFVLNQIRCHSLILSLLFPVKLMTKQNMKLMQSLNEATPELMTKLVELAYTGKTSVETEAEMERMILLANDFGFSNKLKVLNASTDEEMMMNVKQEHEQTDTEREMFDLPTISDMDQSDAEGPSDIMAAIESDSKFEEEFSPKKLLSQSDMDQVACQAEGCEFTFDTNFEMKVHFNKSHGELKEEISSPTKVQVECVDSKGTKSTITVFSKEISQGEARNRKKVKKSMPKSDLFDDDDDDYDDGRFREVRTGRKSKINPFDYYDETKGGMCKVCKFIIKKGYFTMHFKKIHRSYYPNDPYENKYECDICQKTVTTSQILRKHKKITHKLISVYKCKKCGAQDPIQFKMKEHQCTDPSMNPIYDIENVYAEIDDVKPNVDPNLLANSTNDDENVQSQNHPHLTNPAPTEEQSLADLATVNSTSHHETTVLVHHHHPQPQQQLHIQPHEMVAVESIEMVGDVMPVVTEHHQL